MEFSSRREAAIVRAFDWMPWIYTLALVFFLVSEFFTLRETYLAMGQWYFRIVNSVIIGIFMYCATHTPDDLMDFWRGTFRCLRRGIRAGRRKFKAMCIVIFYDDAENEDHESMRYGGIHDYTDSSDEDDCGPMYHTTVIQAHPNLRHRNLTTI